MVKAVVDFAANMVATFVEHEVLSKAANALFGAQVAANIIEAGAVASAWSPAAAFVSLASFGANGAGAAVALTSTMALAKSLASIGGLSEGADSVPRTGLAILHEEERVVPRESNKKLAEFLDRNSGNGSGEKSGSTLPVVIKISEKVLASVWIDLRRKRLIPAEG